MQTYEVLRVAIGDRAKAVRESLRALGKTVSLRWIYYLCQPPADVRRLNPYDSFLLLFEALRHANREGAEYLFVDFCARADQFFEADGDGELDTAEQLSRCVSRHSAVVGGFLRSDEIAHLRRAVIESIVENRRLLACLARAEGMQKFANVADRAPPPLGRVEARGEAWQPLGVAAAPGATGGRRGAWAASRGGTAFTQASPSDACNGREALMKD